MIAPLIAASDPRIAAIALLAGPGKRGDEAITDQVNYELDSNPTLSAAEKQAARAAQQEFYRVATTGGDLSKYPAEAKLPWVKAFITYDPLPTIRLVRQPVLILQGALDRQVTAGQATLLEEALTAAETSMSQSAFSRTSIICFFRPRQEPSANTRRFSQRQSATMCLLC
jgi:hypothetical protein